jgi:hypothetical protein
VLLLVIAYSKLLGVMDLKFVVKRIFVHPKLLSSTEYEHRFTEHEHEGASPKTNRNNHENLSVIGFSNA